MEMAEFTCAVCGTKGLYRLRGKQRKYCSKECKRRADNVRKGLGGRNGTSCKYNECVACEIQRCENCGWNPVVEERRKAKILEGRDYGEE